MCVFFGGGGGVNGGLLKVEKRKKPHASHVIQQKLVVGVANQFLDKEYRRLGKKEEEEEEEEGSRFYNILKFTFEKLTSSWEWHG